MSLSEESVVVVCPNPKCRRRIEEPILLTNLSFIPAEQYDACPHCFTKLEPETTDNEKEATDKQAYAPSVNAVLEKDENPSSQLMKKVEGLILASNEPKEKEKETGCPQDFGYLANRPKDTPIPHECLLCQKMVDCMLKVKE
jgi:hypothetical protein